ncbi:CoaE-domain-containing protein [Schizopora paradoxa]|uniref:CoaE-domain-containing protein n=1 Tax=Schizopora paradoxa TaxID=27342 RepID=A0A0H2S2Q3_9AGAM|nr:CoaE-domain-containing protein [Schizopora paradoxa]
MLVVGLTGGIATGKSTVSALLKSHGVPIVDADVLARQVVEPGTKAYAQIVSYFGADICHPDGSLDRPKLGKLVFNDAEKRKKLNSIVHPAVRKAMVWKVVLCWLRGERICVLDVPLLIEAGLWKWVGRIVVVSCPEEMQLTRLMSRDNFDEETARSRISSQMPISEKASYADEVIDNTGSKEELASQIDTLILKLRGQARWMWLFDWLSPPVGVVSAFCSITFRNLLRKGPTSTKRL